MITKKTSGAETPAWPSQAPRSSGLHGKSPSSELGTHSNGPVPPIVQEAIRSPGRPLDAQTRNSMEPRFGYDFSRVRIHDDTAGHQAANAIGAMAFTRGDHVAFLSGRFAPNSTEGAALLAHELAHVVQQRDAPRRGADRIDAEGSPFEHEARMAATRRTPIHTRTMAALISRQGPATPAAATPLFSVDQAQYEQLLGRAVTRVGGAMVDRETFSTIVQPIMLALLQSPEWHDSAGVTHGGATVHYVHPGPPPLPLSLRLVLDDTATPADNGHFTAADSHAATITLSVRRNTDVETALTTSYHESMHLVAWLLNRPQPAIPGPAFARRNRELNLQFHQTEMEVVAGYLETLALSVSNRRPVGSRPTVTRQEALRVARFLVEEVHVRAETEVFRLVSDEQAARAAGGPSVLIGTTSGEYASVNRAMVDKYVFEFTSFSPLFRATDRAGLNEADQDLVTKLSELLESIYQSSVRHRHERPRQISIPRADPGVGITPLQPPSFLPRIEESTHGQPF